MQRLAGPNLKTLDHLLRAERDDFRMPIDPAADGASDARPGGGWCAAAKGRAVGR